MRVHFEGINQHLEGARPFSIVLETDTDGAFLDPEYDRARALGVPLYVTVPWPGIHGETIVSLGIAEAAIDKLVDLATRKKPSYSRIPLHDREMVQHHAGKARGLVDATGHLMVGSPAIDNGTAAGGRPSFDIDDDPRPYPAGGEHDIGCDEWTP